MRLYVCSNSAVLRFAVLMWGRSTGRILFAFDPRRCAILLIGGDKTGNERWYQEYVPIADELYDEHLATLRREEQARHQEDR